MKSYTLREALLASTFIAGAFAVATPAFSQQAETVATTTPSAAEVAEKSEEAIVVTGSRLRQNAFSSPSPLTTLNVDENRRLGVTTITELISRSTVSNGARVDASLNTNAGNSNATEAPPTGGTGSSNINLRGLSPERTLVLLNGRRLAATGVRGAPAQPDIGLIPFSMVERVDIATEAGSSVYGADAVAGTVNVILRKDFEGFEVTGTVTAPEAPGGKSKLISMVTGAHTDRARLLFGAEYFNRSRVTANTRSYSQTLRDIEVDADGNLLIAPANGFFDNNLFDASDFAIICYTPGQTGSRGVADFTRCGDIAPPPGFNNLGDSNFIYFDEFNDNSERGQSDLVGNIERISIMTTGEYDLNLWGNEQLYFEAFYFDRQNFAIGTVEQIFPTVTGLINEVDGSGNVIGQVDNPFNPFANDVIPILTLDDIPQTRDVELQQVRLVGGMRGDFNGGWFGENDWKWDAYGSYDRGTGFQSQPILFENNLIAALQPVLNPDGSVTCSTQTAPDVFGFLSPENCVPVNLFAQSIFDGGANGNGAFATQAERDFLISTRTNRTEIEQYVFNAFVDGKLMESPWGGDVSVGFGYEYRKDIIDSKNSLDGVRGLNAAENGLQEGETRGGRSFNEFFGEISVPLIVDRPGINLLSFDGALRQTHESNFGNGTTYRVRGQYKPVDWMSFSGGYGTSFRAPNLRETFLANQGGGVGGGNDPCINNNIQLSIGNAPTGDADEDLQFLIANCIASGVIFTDTDANGNLDATPLGTTGVTTIATTTGGNLALEPERSRTFTATFSATQPWFESFDFRVATSYYDVRIRDSVEEPGIGQIVGGCYFDRDFPNQTSPFCDLLTRKSGSNPNSNQLNLIDITFFNIGEITAKGLDFNTQLRFVPFELDGSPVDFTFSTAISRQLEQETQVFSEADRDDNVGEIGTPKWRANFGTNFAWNNFSLDTEHRVIGKQQQDNTEADRPNPFFISGTPSHDLDSVGTVWYHDASVTYNADTWAMTIGARNILDKEPPLIDDGEGPNRNNAVTSSGYDFFGRTFFVTARKAF